MVQTRDGGRLSFSKGLMVFERIGWIQTGFQKDKEKKKLTDTGFLVFLQLLDFYKKLTETAFSLDLDFLD